MSAPGPTIEISPAHRASGRLTLPGDKSISHRYAMLAALAEGTSVIHGYSRGMDCLSTLACIRALGIEVETAADRVVVHGRGLHGLSAPSRSLDAGNSGTTMRLMAGILAGQPFTSRFEGDASLTRRPMRRIIEPLGRMGARIGSHEGRPPLEIVGSPLRGISYAPAVPSAQVKSCVLLAGLYAEGATSVSEPAPTRDHTERAFRTFGAPLRETDGTVQVEPGLRLQARELTVPGDISGAAFWCAAAAATPGGDITIENVGLNPSRTALLDVLRRIGARVAVSITDSSTAEPVGMLRIQHEDLQSFEIAPGEVPGLIDEIPALAALAAMMPSGRTMTVRGAGELRVKESDRIAILAEGFRRMGSVVEEFEDGFTLEARPLRGGVPVLAAGDHRLAMAFAIAATHASAPVSVVDAAVEVSYPGFWETLAQVAGDHR